MTHYLMLFLEAYAFFFALMLIYALSVKPPEKRDSIITIGANAFFSALAITGFIVTITRILS